jgi:hypothetical protein
MADGATVDGFQTAKYLTGLKTRQEPKGFKIYGLANRFIK